MQPSPRRFLVRSLAAVALLAVAGVAFVWDTVLMTAMAGGLHMNDFGKFYYSTRAYLERRDMYAPTPATDLRLAHAEGLQFLNMNPPHFHLLVLPLARLAPMVALECWMAAGIFAFALSMLLVAREVAFRPSPLQWLTLVAGTLAFAGTQAFFMTGQLSMLLLLPITLSWLEARRGRWVRAAVWLGLCLSVKPFLLIFLPYLIGTRRYRAAATALATGLAAFALGLLVFGVDAHRSWIHALARSRDWAWAPMNASIFGALSRTLAASPYFTPLAVTPRIVTIWVGTAGMVGAVTLAAAVLDRGRHAIDRAFALLLTASQLVSPLGWIYYLWLAAGPMAALSLDATARRSKGSRGAAIVAGTGFLWPLAWLDLFQPRAWATIVVASAYFWATMALWIWLLLEWMRTRSEKDVAGDMLPGEQSAGTAAHLPRRSLETAMNSLPAGQPEGLTNACFPFSKLQAAPGPVGMPTG